MNTYSKSNKNNINSSKSSNSNQYNSTSKSSIKPNYQLKEFNITMKLNDKNFKNDDSLINIEEKKDDW